MALQLLIVLHIALLPVGEMETTEKGAPVLDGNNFERICCNV